MTAKNLAFGMTPRNTNFGFIAIELKDTIRERANCKPHAGNRQDKECLMRRPSQRYYCFCITIHGTSKRGGFRAEPKD